MCLKNATFGTSNEINILFRTSDLLKFFLFKRYESISEISITRYEQHAVENYNNGEEMMCLTV